MPEKHNPNVRVFHANHGKKSRLHNSPKFTKVFGGVALVVFAAIGVWILGNSFASTNTTTTTTFPTSTCGARVSNYTYKVPFGNAVWNQPVCNLLVDAKSADYSSRFWNYRNGNDLSPTGLASRSNTVTDFGFESLTSNFSRPVYYAKDANRTIQIRTSVLMSNLDGILYNDTPILAKPGYLSNFPATAIPWNDSWETGRAGDNEMVILNDQTGEIIFLSGVRKDPAEAGLLCGILAPERLCTYDVKVSRKKDGAKIDYRKFEGSTGDRGSGISWYATLTTPEEVAAGEIRHAIGMATANTAIGPECTKSQRGTSAEGITCGTAVAPASKFEWASATSYATRGKFTGISSELNNLYTQKALIPEGARFKLNVDDAYVENWINSRSDLKSDPQKAQTARIFARAMRDYGIIIVDTSGVSTIQVSSVLNPKTKAAWANLGINDKSDNNLLNGLINETNVSMIAPPVNNCNDGTKSTYYCGYETSSYSNSTSTSGTSTTPQSNTAPSVSISSPALTYTAPANITLNATASDQDGSITKVEFYNGTTKIGEDTNSPYSISLSNMSATQYSFNAKAFDDKGASGDSQKISIAVNTSQTPVTQPIVTLPTTVTIPNNPEVGIKFNTSLFEFDQSVTLSWGESSSPNGIKNYIINKNGQRLYEGTARQFIDFGVNDGQRYRYDIFAVDNKGFISSPASYDRTFACTWFGLVCTF